MAPLENDRWQGSFLLEENATYQYTIVAWRDTFLTWALELRKKHAAGMELTSELLEGKVMVERALDQAAEADRRRLEEILGFFDQQITPVTERGAGAGVGGADRRSGSPAPAL